MYAWMCVCVGWEKLAKLLNLKRVFMYFVTQENEMCKSKCQRRRGDFWQRRASRFRISLLLLFPFGRRTHCWQLHGWRRRRHECWSMSASHTHSQTKALTAAKVSCACPKVCIWQYVLTSYGWCVCADAFRVQIGMRPLQYSGDTVIEARICTWIVCAYVWVCLSPVFSGPAIQRYIRRVDSSRLNVSLDITHKAPPKRQREGKGGRSGGWGCRYVYECVRRCKEAEIQWYNGLSFFLLNFYLYSQL